MLRRIVSTGSEQGRYGMSAALKALTVSTMGGKMQVLTMERTVAAALKALVVSEMTYL